MKDEKIIHKVINGLLKRGYNVSEWIIKDIRHCVAADLDNEKRHPYYILSLVCDYGFYIGMRETGIHLEL